MSFVGNPSCFHKDHLKTIAPWLHFVYEKEAEKIKLIFLKFQQIFGIINPVYVGQFFVTQGWLSP